MMIRSQCGRYLIQCKNIIMEQCQYSTSPRFRISEITRNNARDCRDFTLGYYTTSTQAIAVIGYIQKGIEDENRLLIRNDGTVERLNVESVYTMPRDRGGFFE
jgi:hypothetical protein